MTEKTFKNTYNNSVCPFRVSSRLRGNHEEVLIDNSVAHLVGYVILPQKKQLMSDAAKELDMREVHEVALSLESRYKIRRFAYLHMISVDEAHQSKGLGGNMVRAFIRRVNHLRAQAIILRATPHFIKNFDRLYRFYHTLGFRRKDPSHPTEMELLLEDLTPANPLAMDHKTPMCIHCRARPVRADKRSTGGVSQFCSTTCSELFQQKKRIAHG